MGFLAGKRILITGLLSERSIAYGIAKAARREGAELAFAFQNDDLHIFIVSCRFYFRCKFSQYISR